MVTRSHRVRPRGSRAHPSRCRSRAPGFRRRRRRCRAAGRSCGAGRLSRSFGWPLMVAGRRRRAPTSRSSTRRGTGRRGRWTGRSAGGCCPGRRRRCCPGAPDAVHRTPRRSRCSARRDQRRELAGHDGQQSGQVVGVPVAGLVGLAEADETARTHAGRTRQDAACRAGSSACPPPQSVPSGSRTRIGSRRTVAARQPPGNRGPQRPVRDPSDVGPAVSVNDERRRQAGCGAGHRVS